MTSSFAPFNADSSEISVSSSSSRVQVGNRSGVQQLRIFNEGAATVRIRWGDNSVVALMTDYAVGPGVTEVITVQSPEGRPLHVAAIAAGSSGKIIFSTGQGI